MQKAPDDDGPVGAHFMPAAELAAARQLVESLQAHKPNRTGFAGLAVQLHERLPWAGFRVVHIDSERDGLVCNGSGGQSQMCLTACFNERDQVTGISRPIGGVGPRELQQILGSVILSPSFEAALVRDVVRVYQRMPGSVPCFPSVNGGGYAVTPQF